MELSVRSETSLFRMIYNNHVQELLNRKYEITHPPTCTKSITIKLNGHILKLKQRMEIVYDGEEIISIPKLFSNGISVQVASSLWLTGSDFILFKKKILIL